MIQEDLKLVILKYWPDWEKRDTDGVTEIFLEMHKELAVLLKRDFEIEEPVICVRELNLIDPNKKE